MIVWSGAAAWAADWCAVPVVAHEWGVFVIGAPSDLRAELPAWFSYSGVEPRRAPPVRELPADNGVRKLPVVQFWRTDAATTPIPIAATVGFTWGTAAAWYPPVDRLALQEPRTQLSWEALSLTDAPTGALGPVGGHPWVQQLRDARALWVDREEASERFLFYEGRSLQASAIRVTAEGWEWVVENRSEWPVHDVALWRGGRPGRVERLAPGERARVDFTPWGTPMVELRSKWFDPEAPAPGLQARSDGCVSGRNPGVPANVTSGHRLYQSEVDAMLSVWEDRLFASKDHLVYREDPAALDAVMPVALYTDMYHWFEWRRLGLVLVEE